MDDDMINVARDAYRANHDTGGEDRHNQMAAYEACRDAGATHEQAQDAADQASQQWLAVRHAIAERRQEAH